MYGKIIIKTKDGMGIFRTTAYHIIYDFIISKGYSHEIAESVASWAQLASCGEHYELDGSEIYIGE